MKKYIIVTMLFVFCLCGFLMLSNLTQPTNGQTQQYPDPFGTLNAKTNAANPNDSVSINGLVDEVFKFMLVDLVNVPSQIKGRIVLAETKYRNNQRDGITETKLAAAIDVLATRFNAPNYAKTNESEIRELRMSMMPYATSLVGVYRPNEVNRNSSVNQTINTKMSPSETVLILLMMIQQKQTHPYYQMTQAEKQAQWTQNHSVNGLNQLPDNNTKTQEMSQVANQASGLNSSQQLALANQVLDVLGIEQ
jgi:hypothetical protein